MVGGEPNETRAFARLPGLDIAVLHRDTRGDGEQVFIALKASPSFGALALPMQAADPFLLWMRLMQLGWASWVSCLAAASTPPWITRSK
ncbi:MAG TPA: hypothetical protein VEY05_13550 [Beijerinckiaceae bacterium]|jgi:hypothetical protein|nr:hypothetical protein [Beijerinckiaceae bacterium]